MARTGRNMDSCVVNFGINCTNKIQLRSPQVLRFAEEISVRAPELHDVNQDDDVFELFQVEGRSKLRQVRVRTTGVQVAAGKELSIEEQSSFIRVCANAVDYLEIPKISLTMVDLRHIFYVKHWGNHNELIAQAYTGSSPLGAFRAAVESPLISNDVAFTVQLSDNTDILVAVNINSATTQGEISSGVYDGDNIDILCGIGRLGGFLKVQRIADMFDELERIWSNRLREPLVENVVQPLYGLASPDKPSSSQ